MSFFWPFFPFRRKKNKKFLSPDITIEVSKFDDNRQLLLLQKELSPRFNIKIHQPDVEFLEASADNVQLLLKIYFKVVEVIDTVALHILVTGLINYLEGNKGTGRIKFNVRKEDEKLDLELLTQKASKEELELQIKQYSNIILNNLNEYRKFTKENIHERKITFVYDERRKLVVPIQYYRGNRDELNRDLNEISDWDN